MESENLESFYLTLLGGDYGKRSDDLIICLKVLCCAKTSAEGCSKKSSRSMEAKNEIFV